MDKFATSHHHELNWCVCESINYPVSQI